ncbi:MAG: tripartite tricarboxylate transporter substrate binding protein [Pseudomonadota bacterium]
MLKTFLAAATSVALSATVAIAEYPEKPIDLIVPFEPGGGTDITARMVQPGLEAALGQKLVIRNLEGAGGTVGATQLSKMPSDGYSIGYMPIGTMTTQPHIRRTSYNADSWEPICMVISDAVSILVNPDKSGIKSLEELVSAASGGNQLISAGPPPGSLPHIGQAALASAYGLDFKYVPYKGGGPTAKALTAGDVDVFINTPNFAKKFEFTPLALMAPARHPDFPDLPTTAELGGPEMDISIWFGLFAPAGTDSAIIQKLSDACGEVVNSDAFKSTASERGNSAKYLSAEEFRTFFRNEFDANAELLSKAGLK